LRSSLALRSSEDFCQAFALRVSTNHNLIPRKRGGRSYSRCRGGNSPARLPPLNIRIPIDTVKSDQPAGFVSTRADGIMPGGVLDAPRLEETLTVELLCQVQVNLTTFRQILGHVARSPSDSILSGSNLANVDNVRVASNSFPILRESILGDIIAVNRQMLMVRKLNDRHPAADTVALTPQAVKEGVPGLSMAFYGDATTLNLPQGQSHEFGSSEGLKASLNELTVLPVPPLGATWTLAGETLATSGNQEKRLATIGTIQPGLTWVKTTARVINFKKMGGDRPL